VGEEDAHPTVGEEDAHPTVGEEDGVTGGLVAGWKVATKGVASGWGSTTGTVPTLSAPSSEPSSTVVVPVAGMVWTVPFCKVPVHSVAPVVTDRASTQHGPVAVSVTLKELDDTG
jgi:hypothetical protein